MKSFAIFFFSLLNIAFSAESVIGYWKTVDESGHPQCILAVYEHEGLSYGRIIATYSNTGTPQIEDSIYKPIKRAPGVQGEPFYSGLDILWNLENTMRVHKGKIMDPEKGKVYKAELWTDGPDLIVRGKLLMFGRNHRWYSVKKEDLPDGFKLPDLNSFIPSVPQVK